MYLNLVGIKWRTRSSKVICKSLEYDSDSEESNSGDFSDGSDEEWKPTAEDQQNNHSDVEKGGIVEFEEEVNSDEEIEEPVAASHPVATSPQSAPPAEKNVKHILGRDKNLVGALIHLSTFLPTTFLAQSVSKGHTRTQKCFQ